MSRKFVILLLLAAAFSFVLPQAHAISWQYDLASALKAAKSQGKPVMMDFYTEWCGWCKKLDSDTYSNANVSAAAKKFICVKIDAEKQPALASKYGVAGFPTIIFLSSNGGIISKVPGFLPPDQFLAMMNKILASVPKPSVNDSEIPAGEGGGFVVLDNQVAGAKDKSGKLLPPKTVGQEFIYNGYIQSGSETMAQINYKGETYFVTKGENFAQFQVASIDKDKVVLLSDNGEIKLEYKRPYGGKGIMNEISRTITQPTETKSLTDREVVIESFPAWASDKARAMILAVTFGILLIFYVYYSLCLQLIAVKTKAAHAWMAWIPVLSLFLMLNAGRIRYRAALIPLFVFFALIAAAGFSSAFSPIIGLVFAALIFLNSLYFVVLTGYIWYKITRARGKSPGLSAAMAIMMLISPLNLIAIGYLAFSK
jgi:thioredoxin-related protein